MNATPATIEVAQALVAKALSVGTEEIGPEAKMYDIPMWDSLGQLSVILAIEEAWQVQVTEESLFRSLTSVPGIAAYLSAAAPS